MTKEIITLEDGRIDRQPLLVANWTEQLSDSPGYVANKPIYYNVAGAVTSPSKVFLATVTPSTGDAYSIDITSAGFTTVSSIILTPIKSTAVPAAVVRAAVKSFTTSAVVINLVDSDTAGFANLTGLTVMVRVEGV